MINLVFSTFSLDNENIELAIMPVAEIIVLLCVWL